MAVKADRYRELNSLCLVLGADAAVVDLVGSVLDAHSAALVAPEHDLLKGDSLGFNKRVRFLERVTGTRSSGDTSLHLVAITEVRSTMRTLRRWPARPRELAALVGVPVMVVNAVRDPFDEAASIDGAQARGGRVRRYRNRLETLERMEEDGIAIIHVRLEDMARDAPGELERLSGFLGLRHSPNYVEECARKVREAPLTRGHRTDLTDEEMGRVELMVDRFPWLKPYRGSKPPKRDRPPKRVRPLPARDRDEASADDNRVKRSSTQSAFTEYFFDPTGASEEPVLLFHHIQKTAGTSLRELIRANLPPVEREARRYKHFVPMGSLLDSFRRDFESFPPERRDSLCCVMSHRANFALPFIECPVEAITVLRDPVDRVVSDHYFRGHGRTLDHYAAGRARGRPGSPTTTSRHGPYSPRITTAALARTRGPGPDADLWRERLFSTISERYMVGVHHRLEEFVRMLAARFGWQETELGHKKTSPTAGARRRPAVSELPEEVVAEIRAYNWLDISSTSTAGPSSSAERTRCGSRWVLSCTPGRGSPAVWRDSRLIRRCSYSRESGRPFGVTVLMLPGVAIGETLSRWARRRRSFLAWPSPRVAEFPHHRSGRLRLASRRRGLTAELLDRGH